MTLTLAQYITVGILAISCFFCGWFFYRLRAVAREAELTRALLDTKGVIPQLESTVRNRDQRVSTLCAEVGDWKNRNASLETNLKEKERDILARDRALRALNAELTMLKEAESAQVHADAPTPMIDEAQLDALRQSLATSQARCQELERRLETTQTDTMPLAVMVDGADSNALQARIDTLEQTSHSQQQLIADLEARLAAETTHSGGMGKQIDDQAAEIARAREELAKWQARVPKLVESIREKDDRLRLATARVESLGAELEASQSSGRAMIDDLANAKTEIAAAAAELESLRARDAALCKERDELLASVTTARSTLEAKDDALQALRGQLESNQQGVAKAQAEFAKKLATSIRLGREEVDRLNGELDRLTRELGSAITQRNDSIEAHVELEALARSRVDELDRMRAQRDEAVALASSLQAEGRTQDQVHADLIATGRRLGDRINELEVALQQAQSQLAANDSERAASVAASAAQIDELRAARDAIEDRNSGLGAECERLNGRIAELEGDLGEALERLTRLDTDRAQSVDQLAAVAADAAARAEELAQARSEVREWHARLAPLEGLLKQRDAALAARTVQIEELRAEIVSLETALSDRSQRMARERERDAEEMPTDMKSEYLENRVANQFEKNRELIAALEERNKALASLEKDRDLKDKSLNVLRQQLEGERQTAERLASQLRDLRSRENAPRPEQPDDSVAPVKPQNLFASTPGDVDDLQQIRGIGAAFEHRLNALGVYQYRQIAGFSDAEIVWLENELKTFRGRIGRDDWIGQAVALMRPPPPSTAVVLAATHSA